MTKIKKNEVIEIVYDSKKHKLRARASSDGYWVRFPNHLREKGAKFIADLKLGNGLSYVVVGDIRKIVSEMVVK